MEKEKCKRLHVGLWTVLFIFIAGFAVAYSIITENPKIEYRDNPKVSEKLEFCIKYYGDGYDVFEEEYKKNLKILDIIDSCNKICREADIRDYMKEAICYETCMEELRYLA